MATTLDPARKRRLRWAGVFIIVLAIVTAIFTFWQTNVHPRTDDAWVFANLIGIAPEVDGPVVKLMVKDNQYVKSGDILFEIEPEPYEYAVQRAISEQQTLEKQIYNEQRVIAGQQAGIEAARATVFTSQAHVSSAEADVNSARANITHAEAGLARANAEYKFASDTLHRLQPLLAKQFVTVEDIDRATTNQRTAEQAVQQAEAQLKAAQAQLESAQAGRNQAGSGLQQSHAQLAQSQRSVTTVLPLLAEREARAAAVRQAQYNLSRCRVVAPFDARVTDLTISEGAYAHIGQRVFTLIDVRKWWVVGNFRESQLRYIQAGMPADLYVMSKPDQKFTGRVDSISYGVSPQETALTGTLPDVQRTLAWVHLATRFPVRVKVDNPDPALFRIGESGYIIVRAEDERTH